jgi:hypothetical protein
MLILLASMAAQAQPKAELVTEFPYQPCEFILAQSDSFAARLKDNPSERATILIFQVKENRLRAKYVRTLIGASFLRAGLQPDRFTFYDAGASPDSELRVQVWSGSYGAQPWLSEAQIWNAPAPNSMLRYLVGSVHEEDICPTYVPSEFAKLIRDNPRSAGRIIVHHSRDSMVDGFWFGEQLIKDLVEKERVPRRRLKLVFRLGVGPAKADIWYVPKTN